ncbi:MAG: hypothetical protein GF416_04540 [Candidatus Altiarchaeales archaeon]|nr:hypothetical protein [Candidatus Altiarchaeales archaeon]MBD3416388.1 hypothetical protein [Candidatus Altiarchaeales archaeon]
MCSKMKIQELRDKTPVEEIVVKVTEVKEPNETRVGFVQQVTVEDETGNAVLTLWNDQIDSYKPGDVVKITKGWCKEYKGDKQISSGKYGTLEKVEGEA